MMQVRVVASAVEQEFTLLPSGPNADAVNELAEESPETHETCRAPAVGSTVTLEGASVVKGNRMSPFLFVEYTQPFATTRGTPVSKAGCGVELSKVKSMLPSTGFNSTI